MNKAVSNFLAGFLAGAAVGALAGILFAPEKGSKTRQSWGKKIKDLSDDYGLGIGEILDDLGLETEPAQTTKKRKTTRKTTGNKEKR